MIPTFEDIALARLGVFLPPEFGPKSRRVVLLRLARELVDGTPMLARTTNPSRRPNTLLKAVDKINERLFGVKPRKD